MERKRSSSRTSIVSGSVWETRIINDEIMGGFKVFNEKTPAEKTEDLSDGKQSMLKQSPVGKRKTWKSDNSIKITAKKSPNGNEKNPVVVKKNIPKRSNLEEKPVTESMEMSDDVVNDLAKLGEVKTEFVGVFDESKEKEKLQMVVLDEQKKGSIELRNEKLGLEKNFDECNEKIEKNPVELEEIIADLGEKKVISNGLINVGFNDNVGLNFVEKELDEKIEKQSIQEIKSTEQKPKKIVNEEKKPIEKQLPITVKKQSPNSVNYSRVNSTPSKTKSISDFDRFQSQSNQHRITQSHGKLQSLIDLVMWRDASKSAFIFGIGTFIIISCSYTKDLNISLISIFSYLGLVYLAAIFIFRSIISRCEDGISEEYVVGEEEALWLLKMVLPYLNECLIKIKALFSGDPATTMKLAVLLYVLARSGSSITIWKMAKLGFFGVFTVPKICSSYSSQLTAYGKFWVRRFRDAWESCSHKKAVGFGIFTLIWNLSSVVARIWAVFMLFVAFKYYQQSMVTDDCGVEEEPKCEPSWQEHVVGGRRLRRGLVNVVTTSTKEKKRF